MKKTVITIHGIGDKPKVRKQKPATKFTKFNEFNIYDALEEVVLEPNTETTVVFRTEGLDAGHVELFYYNELGDKVETQLTKETATWAIDAVDHKAVIGEVLLHERTFVLGNAKDPVVLRAKASTKLNRGLEIVTSDPDGFLLGVQSVMVTRQEPPAAQTWLDKLISKLFKKRSSQS